MTEQKKNLFKTLEGTVSSCKNEKTLVVTVTRKFKDKTYSKFVNNSKKYVVSCESFAGNVGDSVKIIESRPLSKTKRWMLVK